MGILFADSFDHYGLGSTNVLSKWTSWAHSASYPAHIVTGGRCSTYCLGMGTATIHGRYSGVAKGLNPAGTIGYVGFAMKVTATGSTTSGRALNSFFTVQGVNGYPIGDWDDHFYVCLSLDDGVFTVYRAGPEVFLGGWGVLQHGHSTAGAFTQSNWHYVEIGWEIHDSAGWITIRVDGVEVLALTGIDTRGVTAASSSGWKYMTTEWTGITITGGSNMVVLVDDLYVCDNAGAVANTFLGDVAVEAIFPEAPGALTQFTPDSGLNWDRVKDTADYIVGAPDGDLSYVQSETAGHRDSHTYTDIRLPFGTVFGIQYCLYTKKLDSGARRISGTMRQGGVTHVGNQLAPTQENYRYLLDPSSINPATGSAYSVVEIDANEFGYELTV
jgi:hypothetical protein